MSEDQTTARFTIDGWKLKPALKVAAVSSAAGKEYGRPALEAIRIELDSTTEGAATMRLIAADGFRLCEGLYPVEASTQGRWTAELPATEIAAFGENARKRHSVTIEPGVEPLDPWTFTTMGKTPISHRITPVDVVFPDYRMILLGQKDAGDAVHPAEHVVSFDPRLLREVLAEIDAPVHLYVRPSQPAIDASGMIGSPRPMLFVWNHENCQTDGSGRLVMMPIVMDEGYRPAFERPGEIAEPEAAS